MTERHDGPWLDPTQLVFGPRTGKGPADDRLDRFRSGGTGPFEGEDAAREATEWGARELARLVLMLEAHGTHGVLVVVQGMDAAGKDEAIHHVMAAVDPGSASARSFPHPTEREARHDYLRRASLGLPARGELAVFNRSYYEQVIADRIHPENLDRQRLPPRVRASAEDGSLWEERYRQIRDFEQYLTENGIKLIKLFLHVSRDQQRQRLLERIERPEKRWDFDTVDVTERQHWDAYMHAYDEAFRATSTERAPWYIIPADHKWFARAAASAVLVDRLRALHDDFPEPDAEQREALEEGRRRLEAEGAA